MDIKAFIRELLFSHDCVIIPGFGGFIGNYSPARIDRVSGLFYPPVKKISFNAKIDHNDGLLISKISQARGTHYGDSRRLVEEFAAELNRLVSRGERIVFDHIGMIFPNSENRLQFEPENDINYLVDSFGLESFHCLPLDEYDVRRRVVRHVDKDSIKQTQIRRNLWKAAVVIPILALLIAVPLRTGLFKNRIETSSLNPLVTAEFENNKKAVDEAVSITLSKNNTTPSDSVSNKPGPSDTAVKEPAPVKPAESQPVPSKPSIPETVTTVPASKASYVIVTGSFKLEENAVSHINALRSEGFKPEIVKAPNGYFRVYAIKCPDMQTALFRKDSISKKYPGTWITKN